MKALVTGAGGFIGRHLATELIARKYSVRGLFLPKEPAQKMEALGIEIFRADLTQPETLNGVTQDIDIVFHLATRTLDWGTRKQFESIMVDGTRHLLEASKGDISRFVYFSSIAALGFNRDLVGLTEDSQRQVCGIPYCDTKIDAEDLVKDICNQNRIDYTIIRPANVIGPGSVWIKEILDAFFRGPFPLIDSGKAPGAFVYVKNLVDGTILAAESPEAVGKTYHFRDDWPVTWGQYLTTVGSWVGKKPFWSIPFRAAWMIGSFLETVCVPFSIRPPATRLAAGVMGKNNDVNNRLAKEELGWSSRVSFNQAMQEIENWVFTHYQLPQMKKINDFHNKRIYITGASSGIGYETACLLAKKGAHLVLMARNEKKLNAACEQIKQMRRNAHQKIDSMTLDVSNLLQVNQNLDMAVKKYGVPDILINSAGIITNDYFENISYETFDAIIKTNLYGVRNVIAALLPAMKQNGTGQIVILGSAAGLMTVFGYTAYGTSKYAVMGLADGLRMELKPHNIFVSVVCPPEVDTPMIEYEWKTITPEARIMKKSAGRMKPEAVAKAIVKGISKRQFLILPGVTIKFLYHTQRIAGGTVSRAISDLMVKIGKKHTT